MSDSALAFEGVSWSVGGRRILDQVSFRLEPGRSLAIVGPSGSGKSSLIACALGLIAPSDGVITVGVDHMTGRSAKGRLALRRRALGVVFQSGELIDEVSARDNALLGPLLAGAGRVSAGQRVDELLERLGLSVIADQPAWSLSGGERQRIAVVRALAGQPLCVLADEPTASLDPEGRSMVADTLLSRAIAGDCAVLVATHDSDLAHRCDDLLVLRGGALEREPVSVRGPDPVSSVVGDIEPDPSR